MSDLAPRILSWYDDHGRHHLPWQQPRTPYGIWIAEVMLQQTQVATVIDYYHRFIHRFPTIAALAAARCDEVLALWSGLGYYSRGRNLWQAARQIVEHHHGQFPTDLQAAMQLPGIGRSTAGAILSQGYAIRAPILDGNVKRLLSRYHAIHGWPGAPAIERQLWQLAESHTPYERLADYTQAVMDLGALICRRQPHCATCPLQSTCQARLLNLTAHIPAAKPRQPRPIRDTTLLWQQDPVSGAVLLQRRPASGIWGGLWSLPETTANPGERIEFAFRHTFTHFVMQANLVSRQPAASAVADNDSIWYKADLNPQLGLPAPIRRLLAQRGSSPQPEITDDPHGELYKT
jgi:A/G-specific adenine glycosylase